MKFSVVDGHVDDQARQEEQIWNRMREALRRYHVYRDGINQIRQEMEAGE